MPQTPGSDQRDRLLSEGPVLFVLPSPPNSGIGRVVPGRGDPPPRAPAPSAPRLRGLGLTRRRCEISCVGELGGSGRMRKAHAAPVSSAPQAVGACRVVLEDVGTMLQAEGLLMLDLARLPGYPEDCLPSIGSVARRCQFFTSLLSRHRRGDPGPPRGRSSWSAGLLQPGVSPPLSPGATGSGMVLTSLTDRVTTVIVSSSCRRSRAGSDKEVTRSWQGSGTRGWSGILKDRTREVHGERG